MVFAEAMSLEGFLKGTKTPGEDLCEKIDNYCLDYNVPSDVRDLMHHIRLNSNILRHAGRHKNVKPLPYASMRMKAYQSYYYAAHGQDEDFANPFDLLHSSSSLPSSSYAPHDRPSHRTEKRSSFHDRFSRGYGAVMAAPQAPKAREDPSTVFGTAEELPPPKDLNVGDDFTPELYAEEEVPDQEALDDAVEDIDNDVALRLAVSDIARGKAVGKSCAYFISSLLRRVLGSSPDKDRSGAIIYVLKLFVEETIYGLSDTTVTVVPGLVRAVSQVHMLLSPLAPNRLGTILGAALSLKLVLPSAINKILAPLSSGDANITAQVISSMWNRVNPSEVSAMVIASGFNLDIWQIPDSELSGPLRQQMELTADGILKRENLVEVAAWAKMAGDPPIMIVISRLCDETRMSVAAKTPLNETKLAPVISALLSGASYDLQRRIATFVVQSFAHKPAAGIELFGLLTDHGLRKRTFIDAAEKKGDNYLFDPQFTSWAYSGDTPRVATPKSVFKKFPALGNKSKRK